MKRDSRGKTGALGAALYAAAVLFLPFIRYRPNRILTGYAGGIKKSRCSP